MKNCKLCVIIDKELAGEKDILSITRSALRGGADMIQLRDYVSADRALIREAEALRRLIKRHKKLFIINNRTDIALMVNADGVHLGQEDAPIEYARKLLPRKIIGISTQSVKQAARAERSGADYIGVGPVFRTSSKPGVKPIGAKVLSAVKRSINIPFFPIGGINLDNAGSLKKLGIDRIAVISAVINSKNVYNTTRLLKERLSRRLK